MIRFDYLEKNQEQWRLDFLLAEPFPHLSIDRCCEPERIEALYGQIPEIRTKSRDYVFAANKYEKSRFWSISPLFEELYQDLISGRFQQFLRFVTHEPVFVDRSFHGGGIHQGREGSFLDMHLDFNYHPLHKYWYRTLNLLLYLNPGWQPEYGGHLKLEDLRSGARKSVGIPFNRLIIQKTCNFTLHGYDTIRFPPGQFRTSVAAYAYATHRRHIEKPRTTDWFVDAGQPLKRFLARVYDPAVRIKNTLFGSATAKH
jgi:hypothetical protein